MKNAKGFISVMLSLVMLLTLSVGFIFTKSCSSVSKYDRAVAALQTAPALIESFSSATSVEKQKLEGYFADAVKALRAYKQFQTDENLSDFITVLASISAQHLSDSAGSARISAIVGLVRVMLGIPEQALATARRGGVVHVDKPNLNNIKDADVRQLETLMKPLPR